MECTGLVCASFIVCFSSPLFMSNITKSRFEHAHTTLSITVFFFVKEKCLILGEREELRLINSKKRIEITEKIALSVQKKNPFTYVNLQVKAKKSGVPSVFKYKYLIAIINKLIAIILIVIV